MMGKGFEFPKPINAILAYSNGCVSNIRSPVIPINMRVILTPKNVFPETLRSTKLPNKHPAVRKIKYKLVANEAVLRGHAKTLHQNLRRRCIGSYINAYMAHDTEEKKQNHRFAEQRQTFDKSGCPTPGFFLFNRCGA